MTTAKTMLNDPCPAWCADGPHPFEADGGDPQWAARWHHLPISKGTPVSVVIDGCDLIDDGEETSTVVINVAETHSDRLRELSPADARKLAFHLLIASYEVEKITGIRRRR